MDTSYNDTIFYCVMLKHETGLCKGHVGYHSVWLDKAAAEDHARLRNACTKYLSYHVVERKAIQTATNYRKGQCVKFDDSAGFMVVNTETMAQIEQRRYPWAK
jgi:hypothetical protein